MKEYNDRGILIFEGEHLKGERNGKGKEYNSNGDLIYEGEYKKGQKWGIGKEYNKVENAVFEGEFINGQRIQGNYYVNGKLIFKKEKDLGSKKNNKKCFII